MERAELMEHLKGLSDLERSLALDYVFVYFDSELVEAALNYATALRKVKDQNGRSSVGSTASANY